MVPSLYLVKCFLVGKGGVPGRPPLEVEEYSGGDLVGVDFDDEEGDGEEL